MFSARRRKAEIPKEEQDKYDVIILDLIMPKKDGVSVLEDMKNENIDKKVIVLTSYNTPDMIRKVSEMGIDYFILKPFELTELEKRIIECTNSKKALNKSIDVYKNNLQISITKILHFLYHPPLPPNLLSVKQLWNLNQVKSPD